jgi:uncharacterized protein
MPLDRASLAARIQEILKNRKVSAGAPAGESPGVPSLAHHDEEAAFARRCASAEASARVLDILGATLVEHDTGACVVVDRSFPLTHRHGREPVERYHGALGSSRRALAWFLRGQAGRGQPSLEEQMARDPAASPVEPQSLLFFDLETTGLSGGAGTYAFLVGFGWFDADAFRTRQFFLRGYGEERALLHAVTRHVTGSQDGGATDGRQEACPTVLVTYNGRSFDVPLIEARYQVNRLSSPFDALAHVDMLFAARRLWKRRHENGGTGFRSPASGHRPLAAGPFDDPPGSCALAALERDVLGLHRQDDVPGWEIPARYFGYARTGDASGLAAVLEHNRLDLVSLGAVTAIVLEMVALGAASARERADSLALGRLLEYLGRTDEAERCYHAAAGSDGMRDGDADRRVRADALHWLALHWRRRRRFQDAAAAWEQLAAVPGLDADRRREALEALAIHHEHRAKDLEAARAFAVSALELSSDARRVDEVRHRLGRLSKKLAGGWSPTQRPAP